MGPFEDMLWWMVVTVTVVVMIFVLVKIFSPDSMSKPRRIVVFDLDETLGSFGELGMFWDAIEEVLGRQDEDHFFEVVDLYPEFLRPKILRIMKYLKDRRNDGSCDKVMIYTNNQGPRSWARMIAHYFDKRAGAPIFDQIIAAFKVRGKVVEVCRTSHGKSVSDLFRCTRLPKDTQICFLDDQFHPDMRADNVYYINVKPYTYSMRFDTMAERYYDHFVPAMERSEFVQRVVAYMKAFRYTHMDKRADERAVDDVISKQILAHLDEFFARGKSATRKRRNRARTGTRKRRN